MPDSNSNSFQQLFADTKDYVKLQADYFKVVSVEKLTILASALLVGVIALIFAMGALFYLFFALAYAFAPLVGGLAVSFAIITGLYLILIALLFALRKKLIVTPLLNLLMNLFYNEHSENEEEINVDEEK